MATPLNPVDFVDQSIDPTSQPWLIAAIAQAIGAAYDSQKAAAITMAVDRGQFNRLLSNQGGVDVRRFAELSDDFWRALVREIGPRVGLEIREPSRRADALADVLIATALALRESDLSERVSRLPSRAAAMAGAAIPCDARRRA